MNKKYIIVIVIAVFGLILSGLYIYYDQLIKNTFSKKESNDYSEKVLYLSSNDNKFYIYNTSTKETTLLPIDKQVKYGCLSSGGILYYSIRGDYALYSYNIKNGNTETVQDFNYLSIGPNTSPRDFSPSCRYVSLEAGTAPGDRFGAIYDIENKKIIDGSDGGGYPFWSPDETKFIITKGTIDFDTGSDQKLDSLYLNKIEDGKIVASVLLSATTKEFYSPFGWHDNETFLYEKNIFSDEIMRGTGKNWEETSAFNKNLYNNKSIEYHSINVGTKEISGGQTLMLEMLKKDNAQISPLLDYKISEDGDIISKLDDSESINISTNTHFFVPVWLTIDNSVSSQIDAILNSEGEKFVYESDFKIYLYDVLTNKQINIPISGDVRDVCSKESNKILYTLNYIGSSIYSYDLKEKKIEVVKNFDGGNPVFLSSDCTYVYTDEGTGPGCRSHSVFNLGKDEFIKGMNGVPTWSTNGDRYVLCKCNLQSDYECYVGEIDSPSNEMLFFTPKQNQGIGDIKWTDNDNFLYSVNNFSSVSFDGGVSQEAYESRIIDYFKFNFFNKTSSSIDDSFKESIKTISIISPSGEYKININNDLTVSKIDGSDSASIADYSGRGINSVDWLGKQKEIGPSAVWSSFQESLGKWPTCYDSECVYKTMEQFGASPDAVAFSRLLSERGFLDEFTEMGRIDLGEVTFIGRVNSMQQYYLINGSPILISTEIKDTSSLDWKKDKLYLEMKNKYPDVTLLGSSPNFAKKEVLPNGNERYIFIYRFTNGCHSCATEYFANIGFDFDSKGTFLDKIFLEITK
ncbi:MAG: hypothetical protein WA091_00930 [Minisyncoccales bacterium]